MASSEAMTTSWPWPPDRRRGSRSARCSMPRVASAALTRSTVSRAGSPRFIGPRATSSKTEPVTPDSWVAGFWKPIPTRVENSCSGWPAMDSPSMRQVDRSALRRSSPGPAPRRPGRASTCRPRWRRPGRRSRRRRGSGRCRGGPGGRSPRSDSRPRSSGACQSMIGRWTPAMRADEEGHEQGHAGPSAGPAPSPCRHRPQEVALARPAERPRLEGQAALLDVGQRGDDDRADDRQQAAQPGPDAALRVEAARPLALADGRRALDERRHRLDGRGRDEREARRHAAPFEVEDEARAGRWSGRTARSRSRWRTAGRGSGRRTRRPPRSRRTARS